MNIWWSGTEWRYTVTLLVHSCECNVLSRKNVVQNKLEFLVFMPTKYDGWFNAMYFQQFLFNLICLLVCRLDFPLRHSQYTLTIENKMSTYTQNGSAVIWVVFLPLFLVISDFMIFHYRLMCIWFSVIYGRVFNFFPRFLFFRVNKSRPLAYVVIRFVLVFLWSRTVDLFLLLYLCTPLRWCSKITTLFTSRYRAILTLFLRKFADA